MKKRLSRKYIVLIVLVAILIASAIAGGVVYARYSQKVDAGTLSIRVDPENALGNTVGEVTYDDKDMPFDRVHPVYPFG